MTSELPLPVIASSVVKRNDTTYALTNERQLLVVGNSTGFTGNTLEGGKGLLVSLNAENARTLRQRLPWLQPVPLGLQTSAGFGDRLGIATPGHVQATRGTGVAPIFAQQSVRENTRTGRSPQQVLDDAMWGIFEAGWHEPWGADADHLKELSDIAPFVKAGYTFYTIDPGDHVDDSAETADQPALVQKAAALAWDVLQSSLAETQERYLTSRTGAPDFDSAALLKAIVKYGGAVVHTVRMARAIEAQLGSRNFDLEMSVDETNTTTAIIEHYYIASELQRLDVPVVSLAPRFVGRFEKGVDYIGDLQELAENIKGHAAIQRLFGNTYKLSLHTGSDKFGVYPISMRATGGLVHLKTAGTSYLEALRLIADVDKPFFREILELARDRYPNDRKTYHVSADLAKVPASSELSDEQLPDLLNQFDARQALHVTFGSVLDTYRERLQRVIEENREGYYAYIKRHFDRHLEPFRREVGV
jgi:hypothetical protein